MAVYAITDNGNHGAWKKNGWILSDFYAFNYLLRGQGIFQVKLTMETRRLCVLRWYGKYLLSEHIDHLSWSAPEH